MGADCIGEYWGYIDWDNAKENGNYHSTLGLYTGNGGETARERTLTYSGSGMGALVIECARHERHYKLGIGTRMNFRVGLCP